MEMIFWFSLMISVYVYFGYPALLWIFSKAIAGKRATTCDEQYLPAVSLVIAAHNEEKVIKEKLKNSLELDYPAHLLEIIIASDGSIDGTNEIISSFKDERIKFHELAPRGGKTKALNTVIPSAKGEILVLSDANTIYNKNAVRKLVRHFADERVGAVSGDVRLIDAAQSHSESESAFYKYERWIQFQESKVGSIIGVDGAMYAIRKEAYAPPPSHIILDDFVISMSVACKGLRVIYDPEAIATEVGTATSEEEFQRKSRVVAGGMQTLLLRKGIPKLNQPFLLFSFFSHKVLRWLIPFFLNLILLSSTFLAIDDRGGFLWFFILEALFVLICLLYKYNLFGIRKMQGAGIPYYFFLVNGAAFFGIFKGLFNLQKVTWKKTSR